MSDKNFDIKKGLNVRNGKLVVDETGVYADGVLVADQSYVTGADSILQVSIDSINEGTNLNVIVIDGVIPPYNGDYSTFANRFTVPDDVDRLEVNTDAYGNNIYIDVLSTRIKPLVIVDNNPDYDFYVYADGITQSWAQFVATQDDGAGVRCLKTRYGDGAAFIRLIKNALNKFVVDSNVSASINTPNGNFVVGRNAGYSNTTGSDNTFIGYSVGYSNTVGSDNNFIGNGAGYSNTIGQNQIFVGQGAGYSFTGDDAGAVTVTNTALGFQAMYHNVYGSSNFVAGHQAGYGVVGNSYYDNTFIGEQAGYSNQTGSSNTFIGPRAGRSNQTGSSNTFIGPRAGQNNTIGTNNTCIGYQAGDTITTGDYNIILGYDADASVDNQDGVAIGRNTLVSHNNSVVFGTGTASDATNTFKIGNATTNMNLNVVGIASVSNKIGVGNNPFTNWGAGRVGSIISVNDNSISGETGQNELFAFANIQDGNYNVYNEFYFTGRASPTTGQCQFIISNNTNNLAWAGGFDVTLTQTERSIKLFTKNTTNLAKDVLYLNPSAVDGATAVAYTFDTDFNLATAGAKIASFKNFGTEVVAIHDGGLNVTGAIDNNSYTTGWNAYWGDNSWADAYQLTSMHDSAVKSSGGISIGHTNSTGTSGVHQYMEYNAVDGSLVMARIDGSREAKLSTGYGLVMNPTYLNPYAEAISNSFTFDTAIAKTIGKIASFKSAGTEIVHIDLAGLDVNGNITITGTTSNNIQIYKESGLLFGEATLSASPAAAELLIEKSDGSTYQYSGRITTNAFGASFYLEDVFTTSMTAFEPFVVNGASAVAYKFDTFNNLTTAGAKIASFKNFGTEVVAITKGGLDVVGSISNGTKWSSGAGSPEGVISGSVGDLYTRTDGGAISTLYVKESGILTGLAITSITSVTTTATVTTTAPHNLLTNAYVVISGAIQTEYNGTYQIIVTGASTFTYTFAGSATSPATGTITYSTEALGWVAK